MARRLSRKWITAAAVTIATLAMGAVALAAVPTGAATAPNTIVMDGARLPAIRQSLAHHPSSTVSADLSRLRKSADADLTAGPWPVMNKKQKPPSGDKHGYYSQAPYWWPGPGGCPYVQKDGQRNPGRGQDQ